MSQDDNYSEEILNAYADGELDESDCQKLLASASRSPELSRRICEIAYLKSLVRSAWAEPASRPYQAARKGSSLISYAMAAGLGALSLLGIMSVGDLVRAPAERVASVSDSDGLPAFSNPANQSRVVFHVSSHDPKTAEELLDQVQLVLENYAGQGRSLKVEVVANNQGIRLLQQGVSPVASRIQAMNASYDNLRFAACGNTLKRLRKESGESIVILPEAVVVESGVSFVTRRQQEGWVYIKA